MNYDYDLRTFKLLLLHGGGGLQSCFSSKIKHHCHSPGNANPQIFRVQRQRFQQVAALVHGRCSSTAYDRQREQSGHQFHPPCLQKSWHRDSKQICLNCLKLAQVIFGNKEIPPPLRGRVCSQVHPPCAGAVQDIPSGINHASKIQLNPAPLQRLPRRTL